MVPGSASPPRSRGWLLGWGLVTLLMMAWAFTLGLFVGQGSLATPEQLASLKEAGRAVPGLGMLAKSEPPPPPEQPQPRDLTFYQAVERKPEVDGQAPAAGTAAATQTSQSTATTVATASTATTHTTAAPPPPAPTTTVRPPFTPQPFVPPPNQPRPQQFTPQPFAPQGSVAPARPAPQPAHPAPAPAPPQAQAQAQARKGRFTVQVASFKDEAQARELLGQLKASGHPAYLVSTSLENVGTRYRVRVGPYQDLEGAQGAAARIRMQLLLAAYVTRED